MADRATLAPATVTGTPIETGVLALGETRKAALVALLGGLALVYTVGFAAPQVLHDAAHDTRHTMSFPCH
jgi:cobalt transporter subunit CbtB